MHTLQAFMGASGSSSCCCAAVHDPLTPVMAKLLPWLVLAHDMLLAFLCSVAVLP